MNRDNVLEKRLNRRKIFDKYQSAENMRNLWQQNEAHLAMPDQKGRKLAIVDVR